MKIRLLSDLHLEGNKKYRYQFRGEDLLVLAGDIHTRNRHHEFLAQIPSDLRILMVAGNHEYYSGVFQDVNDYLRNLSDEFPNFTFLDNGKTEVEGIPIFGGTMFTDFTLGNNPYSEVLAMQNISDFHVSKVATGAYQNRRWTTNDHVRGFNIFTAALEEWLEAVDGVDRRMVISHFVPAPQLIHHRWRGSELNAYFARDMTKYMGWKGLWLCGHTHDCGHALISDTELWCNPLGYGTENIHFNDKLIVEI